MIKKLHVPIDKVDFLYKHIAKLNKKAMKLGTKNIEIISKNTRIISYNNSDIVKHKIVDIELEYEVSKLDSFTLLAHINHTYEEGNIITKISKDIELPKEYYNKDGVCDHCNINHKRKYTFVILDEYGEYKQIGKSCIKDYTGHDISNIFNIVESIEDLDELVQNYSTGISSPHYIDTKMVLGISKKVIDEYGFNSKSKSLENHRISTSDIVYKIIYKDYSTVSEEDKIIYDDIYNSVAYDVTDEEVISAIDWLHSLSISNNDYLNNIKVLGTSESILLKHLGYVVSILPAYRRNIEDNQKDNNVTNEDKTYKSKHIGNIKDKLESYLTLEKVISIDTMYGMSNIMIFKDDIGNIFKWFTSTNPDIELEQRVYMRYTIKSHDEYLGENQTSITRAKILK